MKSFKVERSEKIISSILLFISSFLVCMQSPLNIFSSGQSSTDSAVFRYVAFAMSKGRVPYRDIFDHKGPLLYFINLLGYIIDENKGIWIVEFFSCFITLFFLYKTTKLFCGWKSAIFSVALVSSLLGEFFSGGNFTEEYALPFIAVSVYFFVKYLITNVLDKWSVFVCGCSFAAVLMLRPNMIGVWIGYILVILVKEIVEKNWDRINKEIIFFIVGIVVVLVPFLVYLLKNDAMRAFIDIYWFFNVSYQANYKYQGSVADIKRVIATVDFYFGRPIVFISILSYILQYIKTNVDKSKRWMLWGSGCSFVATYVLICMPGVRAGHYAMVLIPVLVVPICMFMNLLAERCKEANIGIALVVLFLMASEILYPKWMSVLNNMQIGAQGQRDYQYVLDIIDEHCEPGDTISVFGNNNNVYVESARLSASKYSYQFPPLYIDGNIYEEYKIDIHDKMPKIIYLSEKNDTYYVEDLTTFIKALGYSEIAEDVYCRY